MRVTIWGKDSRTPEELLGWQQAKDVRVVRTPEDAEAALTEMFG